MVGTPTVKNDKLIDTLAGHFPKSYSTSYGISSALPHYLMTPQLRGFWPFSSVDERGNLIDLSGQGRNMTNVNTVAFGAAGLVPYADFVSANTERFQRSDEPGLSITGGITVAAWVYFDAPSTGAETGIISKWLVNNASYALIKTAANVFRFQISDDAATVYSVDSTVTYAVSTWFYILGNFVPSVSQNICVNGVWTTDVTGIPAAIYDSDRPLYFGSHGAGSYLDGRMSFAMLAANGNTTTFGTSLYHHSRPMFGVRS